MRKVGTCCLQDVLGVGEALASLLLDAAFYEIAWLYGPIAAGALSV